MSVPLAIDGRLKKGDTEFRVLQHILKRTGSLVLIGVLMVNTNRLDAEVAGIDRNLWALLMYVGVILSWRVTGRESTERGRLFGRMIHWSGIVLLLFVMVIFRTSEGGWLTPQWWGILGIIGWSYLVSTLAYLFLKRHLKHHMLLFIGLLVYHGVYASFPWLREEAGWLAINSFGAHPSLTYAGMVATLVMYRYKDQSSKLFLIWGGVGLIFLVAGFGLHPLWGISKIGATPTWVHLSLGIAFAVLILVWYVTEIKSRTGWAQIFYPAGAHTFLTYLLPSVFYHLIWLAGFAYPEWMSFGWGGLARSVVFTLVMIQLAGLLARWGVRLKL
jgi:predicted acyltransferase